MDLVPDSASRMLAISAHGSVCCTNEICTTTTSLLLMMGWPKIKKSFPHDTQVKVLTDFSSCAYFWFRADERKHLVKQFKESRTPAKCVTFWDSLCPTLNICFLTWTPLVQGWGSEQFSSAEGLPSSRVPLGPSGRGVHSRLLRTRAFS